MNNTIYVNQSQDIIQSHFDPGKITQNKHLYAQNSARKWVLYAYISIFTNHILSITISLVVVALEC